MLYTLDNIQDVSLKYIITYIFKDYPDIIQLFMKRLSWIESNNKDLLNIFIQLNNDLISRWEITIEYEKWFISWFLDSLNSHDRYINNSMFLDSLKIKEKNEKQIEENQADSLLNNL